MFAVSMTRFRSFDILVAAVVAKRKNCLVVGRRKKRKRGAVVSLKTGTLVNPSTVVVMVMERSINGVVVDEADRLVNERYWHHVNL